MDRFDIDSPSLKSELQETILSAWRAESASAGHMPSRPPTASGLLDLRKAAIAVGEQPPQPPTVRGRLGAAVIAVIRRSLFWYSQQIIRFQAGAAAQVEALAERVQNTERELIAVREDRDRLLSYVAELQTWRSSLLAHAVSTASRAPEHPEETLGALDMDGLYFRFEDQFRGSREEIRRRLSVYLPLLAERALGSEDMAAIDVGCGRGEWLELLREQGLHAKGVDGNSAMVEFCRGLNLDVTHSDLFAYLRAQPARSAGLITLFHVLEHLPPCGMIEAIDHCVRILRPRGAVIFETPNPANVLVGAHTFYTDLTHRSPVPPDTLRWLAAERGLRDLQVWYLNPYAESFRVRGELDVEHRFNELMYGPRDYAVIGFRN